MKSQRKYSMATIKILITSIVFISGCTGAMARKSPEELAKTPDSKLCDVYFMVTSDMHASSMDIGRRELAVVYDEFSRRGVEPEKVSYHCAKKTEQ